MTAEEATTDETRRSSSTLRFSAKAWETTRCSRRMLILMVAWSVTMFAPVWNLGHEVFIMEKQASLTDENLAFQLQKSWFVTENSTPTQQNPQLGDSYGYEPTTPTFVTSTNVSLSRTVVKETISQQEDVDALKPLPANRTHWNSTTTYLSLSELTMNPLEGSIKCQSPYMIPIYDRIVPQEVHDTRKIPRHIHVSFNQRCVPDELAFNIQLWKEALPDHSFYFHDDEAVERLLQQAYWDEEFPDLRRALQCVKFKGAMKIDVWRILILYLFGGLYTDIDVTPGTWFNTSTIHPNDTFFSLSDAYDRPSQWLFAMTPRHPIAQLTEYEIQRRLLKMKNIAKPRVVYTTGPQALKAGRKRFELLKNEGLHGYDGMRTTKISKDDTPQYIQSRMDEIVPFQGVNMTVRNKTEQLSGIIHWPDQVKQNKSINYDGVSCHDYLAAMEGNEAEK
jgi:mannosyltransferase OCH1-like enzyme